MNAAQLLKRVAPPPPSFTSDALKEDFNVAVELLLLTPKFLIFLQEADEHYNLLGSKARAALDNHLESIEDFTGQWGGDS